MSEPAKEWQVFIVYIAVLVAIVSILAGSSRVLARLDQLEIKCGQK